MTGPAIHPAALVESHTIGAGTRIWAFVHIQDGATIGCNCNIGDHSFVETGVSIGNNVTIKNHVCIWDGVSIADDAFIGPHVVFTNDRCPRSPRMDAAATRYVHRENWLCHTAVETGCSIGANATILPGLRLGQYSMIAAGSTVTRDVPAYTLVMGNPARPAGRVCRCGARVADPSQPCSECRLVLDELLATVHQASTANNNFPNPMNSTLRRPDQPS